MMTLVLFSRDTHGLYPVGDSLLHEINLARSRPLGESSKVNEVAQKRAEFLTKNNQWSHEGFPEFFQTEMPRGGKMGEILAKDFNSKHDIIDAWLRSDSHRKVMLENSYEYFGVGRSQNVTVVLFWK
jgi:uncharacterized protein YkwD